MNISKFPNKKLILINLFLFLSFISVPPGFLKLFRSIREISRPKYISNAPKANSSAFFDKKFSHTLFIEKGSLEKKYKSFIGWRPKSINLKYTKINKPYFTRNSIGEEISNSTWFFGGSSMWGWGSSDYGTIPSIYHSKTNLPVFNFGEQGWTSRQSLNQFISAIGDGHRPSVVIFYSGMNDIHIGCKFSNSSLPIHSREEQISSVLSKKEQIINLEKIKNILIEPYLIISNLSKKKFNEDSPCLTNKSKANSIASHLVNNWYSAFLISKSYNSKFYAILQPNIFSSQGDLDKLILPIKINEINEYKKLYPLIIEEVQKKCLIDKSFCSTFVDGSKWIESHSNVFIDEVHLNQEGNSIIVDNLERLQGLKK